MSGRRVNNLSMLLTSWSASSCDNPRPLRSAGRVATFQNSAMFWEQKKTASLLPDQLRNCLGCLSAKRVSRLSTAEQDICVNEDTHQWSRPSYMASRLTA